MITHITPKDMTFRQQIESEINSLHLQHLEVLEDEGLSRDEEYMSLSNDGKMDYDRISKHISRLKDMLSQFTSLENGFYNYKKVNLG